MEKDDFRPDGDRPGSNGTPGVDVAGCTNDGLLYTVTMRERSFRDLQLWVHSGVQEKWHWLTTLWHPVQLPPGLDADYLFFVCLISAALSPDKRCVDVLVEAAPDSIASTYLFRFFISNPKENCFYLCSDETKIRFDGNFNPVLAWLGQDCLLLADRPLHDNRIHIFRIGLEETSKVFTLTDLLAFDMEIQWPMFCADEDFLYIFGPSRDAIKLYQKLHDGTVQLFQEVIVPVSQMHDVSGFADVIVYPSTDRGRLLLRSGDFCYMFDCTLQSFHSMFSIEKSLRPFPRCQNIFTASRAQFFWQKLDLMIGQKCINVPSLQYVCLRKLCETCPALQMCTDEKEAKKMGISYPIWNRFFKPLVESEES